MFLSVQIGSTRSTRITHVSMTAFAAPKAKGGLWISWSPPSCGSHAADVFANNSSASEFSDHYNYNFKKYTRTHTFTIIYIYYRYIVIYIYARSQKYLNCIRAWVRERERVFACVRVCVCVYKCAIGHEMVDINTLHQGTPLWIMALPVIASSPVVSENMVSQNPTVYRFPCELCRVGACRPCRSSCSGARSRSCSQPCLGSGLPILPRLKGFQEAIKGSYCILFDSESRMLSPGKFRSGLWAAVRGRYRCKRTS